MDSLRSNYLSNPSSGNPYEDEDDIPGDFPVIVAQGERRLQVRAYCHWSDLQGGLSMPLIGDLKLDQLPDIAPHAVLMDFSHSVDDPRIVYVGEKLARECGITRDIHHLDDIPHDSMLARVTGQYGQVVANQSPIGFEDEFVNQRSATILYRGMLLPFSDKANGPIRFGLGVVNWKEAADQALSDQIAREMGAAFENGLLGGIELPADPTPAVDPSRRAAIVSALGALHFDEVPDEMAQAMSLADWLASARELAQAARFSADRSRQALYAAIGRAYDFALAAKHSPDELAKLVHDAGIKSQPRAPLLPLVKLVFGLDYDKTRLTEYASALAHAQRTGLGRGELAAYLAEVPGGLKGVVGQERRLRHAHGAKDKGKSEPLARQLRQLNHRALHDLPTEGAEFTVLVARRLPDGTIALLGEVDEDPALLSRAAQHLIQ
ncbi:hypothetical protein EOE18_10265 [Novosphingobium umbonatum]|uniref:Uncharacterized protein n=1 Tax=Novosphingobium umbonatum TaxID=1908524 RepID=A0A437N5G7_9SPHN|nr:hypothetical protein [Novosphingobium umbonatum]RVU05101.1 hypothetical protein EOE18_10265 [Novosphingobium umbonatum]